MCHQGHSLIRRIEHIGHLHDYSVNLIRSTSLNVRFASFLRWFRPHRILTVYLILKAKGFLVDSREPRLLLGDVLAALSVSGCGATSAQCTGNWAQAFWAQVLGLLNQGAEGEAREFAAPPIQKLFVHAYASESLSCSFNIGPFLDLNFSKRPGSCRMLQRFSMNFENISIDCTLCF